MPAEWIHVRNWEKFQHYRDRNPPWIKMYTELLHDDAWLELSAHRRTILLGIHLMYAISRRELRKNTASLSGRLNVKVTSRDLEALRDAGFIEITLAKRYQDASEALASNARSRETDEDKERAIVDKGSSHARTPARTRDLTRIDPDDILQSASKRSLARSKGDK